MVSKFDICSRALVELGEETISSFTANTPPSEICSLVYPEYIKYLLSSHPWKFNTKKTKLVRLATDPLNEWKYAYQLPSDLLMLIAFFDSSSEGAIPKTYYELFENAIFTNEEEVYIDYQFQPDESYFPPFFVEFVVMALSSKLARPITDDDKIEQIKTTIAFGTPSENGRGGLFAIARRLDAIQNPSPAIRADDLLNARFS